MKKEIKKNKLVYGTLLLILSAAPFLTEAKTFKEVVDIFTDGLAKVIVQLLFTLAAVCFFWGIAQYVLNPYQDGKDKGKKFILWGLIGLVVMFSVYSLIEIINGTFF